MVESINVAGNKVYLRLSDAYVGTTITYLPGHFYEGSDKCYQGPWIMGQNGVGALSFDKYLILVTNLFL